MKKKLKLILLSTDKAIREVRDGYYKNVLSLNNTKYDKSLELFRTIDGIKVPNPQHLYAISDEKPKIGDYVYNSVLNILEKFTEVNNDFLRYKVIITTNESLKIEDECKIRSGKMVEYYPTEKQLPTFTNDFLDTYIKKYNDGKIIKEIEVEYKSMSIGFDGTDELNYLKVNPDNTVDVSLVGDKLYTKEEVIDFIVYNKKTHYL